MCEINHWRICFGIQWKIAEVVSCDDNGSVTEVSFSKSKESTADTVSLASYDEGNCNMIDPVHDTPETIFLIFNVPLPC